MTKNSFTRNDVGAACVFAGFDGGSYSATITLVHHLIGQDAAVVVRYFPAGSKPAYATVRRADWHRITLFPKDSKFLVLETL